jgi:uncharacterized integral membrane protein (TIGR00697 family)
MEKDIFKVEGLTFCKDDTSIVTIRQLNSDNVFTISLHELFSQENNILHNINKRELAWLSMMYGREQVDEHIPIKMNMLKKEVINVSKPSKITFTMMVISVIYATLLILSNVAANKLTIYFGHVLAAGFLFFPLTYVINDITTEVYGFKASRRIIWLGLFASILTSIFLHLVVLMPDYQGFGDRFNAVFDSSYRIFIASVFSYFVGEYINSFIMSKGKVMLSGRFYKLRSITSTSIAVIIESFLFFIIAFYNIVDNDTLLQMFVTQSIIKIIIATFCSPISKFFADIVKRIDHSDVYDIDERYSPFYS